MWQLSTQKYCFRCILKHYKRCIFIPKMLLEMNLQCISYNICPTLYINKHISRLIYGSALTKGGNPVVTGNWRIDLRFALEIKHCFEFQLGCIVCCFTFCSKRFRSFTSMQSCLVWFATLQHFFQLLSPPNDCPHLTPFSTSKLFFRTAMYTEINH